MSSDIESVARVVQSLRALASQADTVRDSVESLVIENADESDAIVDDLLAVYRGIEEVGSENAISIYLDEENTSIEEIVALRSEDETPDCWKVVLSKSSLNSKAHFERRGFRVLFFLEGDAFTRWLKSLDPLSGDGAFDSSKPLMLVGPGVNKPFGGPRLAVLPLNSLEVPGAWPKESSLPSETSVREQVHLVPSEPRRIDPAAYELTWGALDEVCASSLRRHGATVLAASLVDVFYSYERVVLKGVRHIEVPLLREYDDTPSADVLDELRRAIEWVYEERAETRRKLLVDRLSLDSRESDSLVLSITENVSDAFQQSCEQYRFVILDRKDEYARELRELLKDLRQQAELYAEKTRSLIRGLLRDAVAAFVFVALALGARVGRYADIVVSDAGQIFFYALAGYFFLAATLQATSAAVDMIFADRELRRWTRVTREYVGPVERQEYVIGGLRKRRITFWIYLVIVVVLYVMLAGTSLYVPELLLNIKAG